MKISGLNFKIIGFALFFAFIGFGGFAFSQDPLDAGGIPANPPQIPVFALNVSPQLPTAGDKITLSVLAVNFPATSTVFTWYRNGAEIASASGLGRASTTIATDPDSPGVIQIRVVAEPEGGIAAEQTAIISVLPNLAAEQEKTISSIASSFSLRASETNPDPGEPVDVEVVTFSFDKQNASYQWSINGVFQRDASGQGKYRISVPGGKEGEEKTVSVTVTTPAGDVRPDSITIGAASTAFYWWADTSIPYWYKGKALPSLNSQVTVMALPGGRSPANLNFQWQMNSSPVSQSSGFGRHTFSFTLGFPVEERIDLAIKDMAGIFSKTASIGIKPFSPSVGVYELRPLRGIVYERALNEFSQRSGEKYDFAAAPFFFPQDRARALKYSWMLNGQEITGEFTEPWLFTLTSDPGTESDNQLNVRISDSRQNGGQSSAAIRAVLHP